MEPEILDLSKTQVYHRHAVVTTDKPLKYQNPVPVHGSLNFGNRIGFACLYPDRGWTAADLFLVRTCPERLDLETGVLYWLSPVWIQGNGKLDLLLLLTQTPVDGYPPVGAPTPL